MKIIYLRSILALLLFTQTAFAQSWQWGLFTGSGSSYSWNRNDLQSDPNGNTYLLGNGNGSFLTSHDGDGNPRWNKTIKNATIKHGNVRVSKQGNVYVMGDIEIYSHAIAIFDSDTTVPFTKLHQDMTLICYDTSGKFKWLIKPDTNTSPLSSYDGHEMYSMDIDEDGNVYCLVTMPPGHPILGSSLTIPTSTLPFGRGFYIIKYNPAGILLSITPLNDVWRGNLAHLYSDNWMNPLLSYNKFNKGFYVSMRSSADDTLLVKGSQFYNTMFLGAFSKEGNLKWHRSDTSTATWATSYSTTPIQIDNSGNIYWSGNTLNENRINGYDFKNVWCVEKYKYAPFILKMDSTAKLLWGMNGGGNRCININRYSGFAINPMKELGLITGMSMGKIYFGDPLKDSIQVNYSNLYTEPQDGWYAFLDLKTGTTKKLGTIQCDSFDWYSPVAHFHENDLYIAQTTNSHSLLFDSSLSITSSRTGGGYEVYLAKYGLPMGCTKAPSSSFTHLSGNFTFTGTTPNDSVTWDFGDGATAKGAIVTHKYALKGKYKVCAKVWTKDCGVLISCMFVDIPVGIDEFSTAANTVNIYPNPANTILTIANTEAGDEIAIYNSTGQKMFRAKASSGNELITVEDWPAGVYFIKITNKNGISQQLSFSRN